VRIVIAGPSGVGKSTVGRLLAARRGVRFIDLDERIGDVAAIFASVGESGFRRRERSEVEALGSEDDVVLVLGGGTVEGGVGPLRDWPRVVLMAEVNTLLTRLGTGEGRPMLAGNLAQRVALLRARRMAGWAAFGPRIHTDAVTADAVQQRVEAIW
jgi:shikimate kinase